MSITNSIYSKKCVNCFALDEINTKCETLFFFIEY